MAMRIEARLLRCAVLLLALFTAIGASGESGARAAHSVGRTGSEKSARLDADAPADADAEIARLLARPLSVDDAERIARLRQPRLRAAALGVEAAEGRRRQATRLPNPELKIDVRRPGDGRDAEQADVEVELALAPFLTLPVRRSIAEAEVDVARHAADRATVRWLHDARIAFYTAQRAEGRWRAAVVALEIAVAARDAAHALAEAGNLTELELARHEAASEAARVEVASLELAHHEARERLQQRLGLHGIETEWTTAPVDTAELEPPSDLADVEPRVLAASRELARLRAELAALAGSERLARIDGWLPALAADVHAERDEAQWEVGGGVRVTVPLFDRRQGQRAALQADLRAAESRLRAAAVDLRSQARTARNRALSAYERARHWRERVVPASQRVVEAMRLQHNAMQVGVFELLEARRAELEAERGANDALFEALVARCELDALLEGASADATGGSDEARSGSSATAIASVAGGH